MFRIRKVTDDLFPMNKNAVRQVKEILRSQFPDLSEKQIEEVSERFHDPLKRKLRSILFVAENLKGRVKGFALLVHIPDKNFCCLDYIATKKEEMPKGIGSALYERCREEAMMLRVSDIFLESPADDPEICKDKKALEQNASRLKFWEKFGARPLANTLYETPVEENDKSYPSFLVIDNLDREQLPSAERLKMVVETILQRKYPEECPEEHIEKITSSIKDDPVQLRPYKYYRNRPGYGPFLPPDKKKPFSLIYNDSHAIHHIRERGYVEAPVKIKTLLKSFQDSDMFKKVPALSFPEKYIRQVHSPDLVDYLKAACESVVNGNPVYPYVFPVRNPDKKPKDLSVLAGYYCMDTFTPIHENVWNASRSAVNCALTGAEQLLAGETLAYALVRPPGHHAETNVYGGFCYLNSAAIGAHYLSQYARIALLDIDYHHGNGNQEIFYKRKDVLTVSLHADPAKTFPYFCGYRSEKGEGEGEGYNLNIPLDEETSPTQYRMELSGALKVIDKFKPGFLVVSFGLDIGKGDPTGSFSFTSKDFEKVGRMIGSMGIPALILQEGGYTTRAMGLNAFNFMKGLYETIWKW